MSFSVITRSFPADQTTQEVASHHDTYLEALREYRRLQREVLPRVPALLMLSCTGCNVDTASLTPDSDEVLRAVWNPGLLRTQYPAVTGQITFWGGDLTALQEAKERLLDFTGSRRSRLTRADLAAFEKLTELLETLQDDLDVPFHVAFPDAPRGAGPDLDAALTPEERAELHPPFPERDPEPLEVRWSRGPDYPDLGVYLEGQVGGHVRYRIRKVRVLRRKTAYVLEQWSVEQWIKLLDSSALGKVKDHAAAHLRKFG